MLGEDVSLLSRLLRCHIQNLQAAHDLADDRRSLPAGRAGQRRIIAGIQLGQRVKTELAAAVRQRLQPGQFPAGVRCLGVGVHAPLHLGSQQRMQLAQVDLRGAEHRISSRAPLAERCLITVEDRHRPAAALVAVGPLRRQGSRSRLALSLVPPVVPGAQSQRRVRQLRADPDIAAPIARIRLLPFEPRGEVRIVSVMFPVPEPAELMLIAQHEGDVASGALRADPARPLTGPGGQPCRAGGGQEIRLQLAGPPGLAPQLQVS